MLPRPIERRMQCTLTTLLRRRLRRSSWKGVTTKEAVRLCNSLAVKIHPSTPHMGTDIVRSAGYSFCHVKAFKFFSLSSSQESRRNSFCPCEEIFVSFRFHVTGRAVSGDTYRPSTRSRALNEPGKEPTNMPARHSLPGPPPRRKTTTPTAAALPQAKRKLRAYQISSEEGGYQIKQPKRENVYCPAPALPFCVCPTSCPGNLEAG